MRKDFPARTFGSWSPTRGSCRGISQNMASAPLRRRAERGHIAIERYSEMTAQSQVREPGDGRSVRPAVQHGKPRPRPAGLFSQLTREQQEAVLAYDGPVGFGR